MLSFGNLKAYVENCWLKHLGVCGQELLGAVLVDPSIPRRHHPHDHPGQVTRAGHQFEAV